MILAVTIQQASLADPPPASVIAAAMGWVSDLLFGPLATIIAVIAIAWIGFAMLSGRIDIKRGLAAVLGCFLLFGAKGMAEGLRSTAMYEAPRPNVSAPAPPNFARSQAPQSPANGYDPYAGAAVMRPRE